MSENRMSTRFRGERHPKRARSPTPPPPPRSARPPSSASTVQPSTTSKAAKRKSPSPPQTAPIEHLPPTRRDSELPTRPVSQSSEAVSHGLKSEQESGILAKSLEQSRQTWLLAGMFERCWTKPVRLKKGQVETPATGIAVRGETSMSKLGSCSMIVEPHTFEITVYSVKRPAAVSSTPNPHPSSIGNYNSPSEAFQGGSKAPSQPSHPKADGKASSTATPTSAMHRAKPSPTPSQPASLPTGPGSVIEMLAARAARDPELKSLMQIVADNRATSAQLRTFQSHIDELSGILKAKSRLQPEQSGGEQAGAGHPKPASTSTTVSAHASSHRPLQAAPLAIKQESAQFSGQAQQAPGPNPAARAKPSQARPDLTAVAFDINGGNGDRFLFPNFSILEHLSARRTEALLSFLVTQKGSEAYSSNYKLDTEYYEPITIKLVAQDTKPLIALGKVIAPAEQTRIHMSQIMSRATLANRVALMTRLPLDENEEPDKVDMVRKGVDVQVPKTSWEAPNSLLPIRSGAEQAAA